MPGLVNAHAHLDLTAVGPQPRASGQTFPDWLNGVRLARRDDAEGITEAVEMGIRASLAGGVVAVGDIAGRSRTEPMRALDRSPLEGVSYLEAFGLGARQPAAITALDAALASITQAPPTRFTVGLSPHAPYSTGADIYEHIARKPAVPKCTHLAECPEERRMVCHGDGPMREFFESVGAWGDLAGTHFGGHASPVAMAMRWIAREPWLLAHVNDCSDDDLRALATTTCSIAYCPRSSSYFEHHTAFGPHRYREMIAAGINVALGTDSVLNLPPGPESERISTLDEMRFLFRRDGVDPRLLVRMATINGARALGLDPARFTMAPGPVAGIVAVPVEGATRILDPAERIARSESAPKLLWPRVVGES